MNLYNGDLEWAINHFTKKHGKPTIIYCNEDEHKDTKLKRDTKYKWPKEHFALDKEK
jgi:hypothetical protein